MTPFSSAQLHWQIKKAPFGKQSETYTVAQTDSSSRGFFPIQSMENDLGWEVL